MTLSESFFDSPWERKVLSAYRRFFAVSEIETNIVLQWVFGATIFSYFIAFNSWVDSSALTIDAFHKATHTCWPYFQTCGEWLFLRTLPEGYSQTILYMGLFGFLILSVYFIYRKDWTLAHLALLPAFLWHTLGVFVLTYSFSGNYEYYLFTFAFILLFLPHKEFFLKLSVVLLYFMSTVAKIHPTWVMGTYFSALKTGLPLFPDWSIPIFTNLVIFMEMVGAWFLLSRRWILQRAALVFFLIFHVYSGILVEYRYPATVLPTLLVLFGPMYRHTRIPLGWRSSLGFLFLGAYLFIQLGSHFLIPGDEKLTMEGNKYGLYMFEANHQCISDARAIYDDGTERVQYLESASARNRCDPYRFWFRIKRACERDPHISSVSWTFDHSINGGPFLRIVDVSDACVLEYKAFVHNEWIKTEKDNPALIGYPLENVYQ